MEHYPELYATQNLVTDAALDALSSLPVIEELHTTPSTEDLGKAIDCLSGEKASGKDGISPEVMKKGNTVQLQHLHELL